MMNRTVKIAVAAFLSLSVMESAAKVTLPQIYTDNMVVQQKDRAPFHGKASPGSTVWIAAGWLKHQVSVNVGADGRWDVVLPTPKGGKKGFEVTFTDAADGSGVTLHNVAAGEVWLCSGQSNMEMPLAGWGKVVNYEQEIAGAVYPQIRLLQVKRRTDMVPQDDTEVTGGGWQVCSPQSVEEFSSIAYFFARSLWEELDVPVGVIDCTWGGSPIEAWVSYATLSRGSGFDGVVKDFVKDGMDELSIRGFYQALVDSAMAGKNPCPAVHPDAYAHKSGFPGTVDKNGFPPCELFNAMLLPMTRMEIRGVLWYQGEQNGDRPFQYQCLFPAMISEWRSLWGKPEMPFYFVQLANYRDQKDVEPHAEWGYLREAQAEALNLRATGMAVAIDVGEAKDIHPKNKQEVARRLALLALDKTYGRKVVSEAPAYAGYSIENGKIYVSFNTGAREFAPETGAIDGFVIAGHDGRFYKGEARREGDRIVVSSPDVEFPVAVRYCWADNPKVGLRGKTGLPVAPFRTDKW